MYQIVLLLIFFTFLPQHVSAEVNVYSARKEDLIKPLLKRFTEDTNIRVNIVTGKADALIQRLELEGEHTPADLLLTTDAARLHRAKIKDLLQPFDWDEKLKRVPESYRDSENYWLGLSLRSRTIIYARDRVSPEELSTIEDLADSKWKRKICVRSSNNIYNQSLVSSLIAANGEQAAFKWLMGFVDNFARTPKGGDRDQIKAVALGVCDVALVNTYYLAGMLHSKLEQERELAKKVDVFWPNQNDRGAHVNVSGIALLKHARHKEEAMQLVRYLVSDSAQQWYADTNFEYPVIRDMPIPTTLQQWGSFEADGLALEKLGVLNSKAVFFMDRAGWR